MVWGGRKEEDSGWGTRVYLWWIHFDIWLNQYNIVKLKNKIKKILNKKTNKKTLVHLQIFKKNKICQFDNCVNKIQKNKKKNRE